ncbi:class I SAM-dependent methyltransferase [Desulfobacter vibrioformis]|uniref:class I SAM-dependent methyltransferase n=1 Tax=Desulfobacter vibrioformis TaxID=34031 RepID=UPI00054F84DA|nr:class I SAM-dependent methyltransferase [Desulfobacter vibrioformis]
MSDNNWTKTRNPAFNRENALHMDRIAKTAFRPIYPVIARNAMDATGVRHGRCLDLGAGPGMLAMAVAQAVPGMPVTAFDFSDDSLEIARENIRQAGLEKQITTTAGDVHGMPFENAEFDLIVSRGSMFFWDDLKGAFAEILRVLAPGGGTYIGGGFGSLKLRQHVIEEMAKIDPSWDCYAKKKTDDNGLTRFEKMFSELSCDSHRIINDDTGFWIVLSKREN